MTPLKKSEQPANSETLNPFLARKPTCIPSPNRMSMVRFMTAAPVLFHAHTFGKTFFIEQKAGIVAAYINKRAKRTAET